MMKVSSKRFSLISVTLLLMLSLPGCGNKENPDPEDISQKTADSQNISDVRQKNFGIDLVEELGLEDPEQIVCGPACAWAITARRDGLIYEYAYEADDTAQTKEIAWSQGEEESLVNIGEQNGTLYAGIFNRNDHTVAVREYIQDSWNTIMTIQRDNPEGFVTGSPLLVDSGQRAYFADGNTVTCFSPERKAVCTWELYGTPRFFRENAEGIECVAAGADRVLLYELREGKAEERWALRISTATPWVIRSGEEAPLCLATENEILFIDRENGALLAGCNRLLLGVPSVMAGIYDAEQESLRLYGTDQGSSGGNLRCSRLSGREEAEQRTELVYGTLGTMGGDAPGDIKAAILAFNQENENYYITVRNYRSDGEPYDVLEQRFHADIVAGKGPDILDLSYCDYYDSYAENGYLVDLTPYLEQSPYSEDIIWNVLNAYEINGGLYVLAPEFWCEGITIHPDYADMAGEWNTEAFLRLLEQNQWEKNVFNIWQGNSLDLLKIMLASRQEEFWSREQGTASFETQEFTDMLALCREYGEQNWSHMGLPDWTHKEYQWNNIFYPYEITAWNTSQYLSNTEIYGREYQIYGFPVASGQVYKITSPDCCGIYSGSRYKEGAWEFMETLLNDKTQRYRPFINPGYPIRRSILEEKLAEEKSNSIKVDGEYITISEEELQIIKNVIYEGTFVRGYMDIDVWAVVEEEASAYFAGSKSAQEVARIIQSRVGLIMAE